MKVFDLDLEGHSFQTRCTLSSNENLVKTHLDKMKHFWDKFDIDL